jgi:hypothetical protein
MGGDGTNQAGEWREGEGMERRMDGKIHKKGYHAVKCTTDR